MFIADLKMITKEQVEAVVRPLITDPQEFLVAVKVSADNFIVVEIDHLKGVDISRCAQLSKAIEACFDREVEDYSLEVASYALGAPFLVPLQYLKYMGHPVTVVCKDGMRYDAVLTQAHLSEDRSSLISISIEIEEKVPVAEGSKKKVLQKRTIELQPEQLKKVAYRF